MDVDPEWLRNSFPNISIFEEIGSGGQKNVYQAEHPDYGDMVLKLFHPTMSTQRALREAKTGEILDSDYVPSVYEIGTTSSEFGDVIWIYEQMVPGRNLRNIRGGEILQHDILRWCYTILEILSEAEEHNIVHRDIKPGNIIIDPESNSWLVDFGLARHLDLKDITATEASKGVGTPGYSPPEQFQNRQEDIDSRSDLFGLGVTLFECIEGVNPFREGAEDRNEVFERILEQQLPPIREPLLESESFQNLLLAMTRREQRHRPSSIQETLDWIQDICEEAGMNL